MIKIGLLGGAENIGKSLYYIENEKEAIIIDAGMEFGGDLSFYGVNKIVPYGTYIKQNISKIKGLFITHIHEDHVGGIRRFLEKYKIPVYGNALALGFIRERNNLKVDVPFIAVSHNVSVRFENLTVRPFSVEHSVLNALGFEIFTKHGTVVAMGDFKIGSTYIDSRDNISRYGITKNPLVLIAESTNSDKDGFSSHESDIEPNLKDIISSCHNGVFIIASFASNMERLINIIKIGQSLCKPIYVMGKSMEFAIKFLVKNEILNQSYIKYINEMAELNFADNSIVVTTGCQGEKNAGLYKLIGILKDKKEKTVLFSSSVIPGNEKSVLALKVELAKNGFDILDDEKYHVSGHCKKDELMCLIKYLNPKFFLPVHGNYFKLLANKENAILSGVKESNIIVAENNMLIKIKKNSFEKMPLTDYSEYITQQGIIDAKTINIRKNMASNGLLIFIISDFSINIRYVGISDRSDIARRVFKFRSNFKSKNKDKIINKDTLLQNINDYFAQDIKNGSMPQIEIIEN